MMKASGQTSMLLWTRSVSIVCAFSRLWSRTGLVIEGIIGDASLWTRQSLLNRQTPNLYTAFATILDTDNLLVNHDRYGMFRPAKRYAERATTTNLHLDMNPWSYMAGERMYLLNIIHINSCTTFGIISFRYD
jgi:hypothetical protein